MEAQSVVLVLAIGRRTGLPVVFGRGLIAAGQSGGGIDAPSAVADALPLEDAFLCFAEPVFDFYANLDIDWTAFQRS